MLLWASTILQSVRKQISANGRLHYANIQLLPEITGFVLTKPPVFTPRCVNVFFGGTKCILRP